jgi:hypothetical protein
MWLPPDGETLTQNQKFLLILPPSPRESPFLESASCQAQNFLPRYNNFHATVSVDIGAFAEKEVIQ